MITKDITYIDYNGTERTETACFNLTKTELAFMSNSVDGGIYNKLVRIVKSRKAPEIMNTFNEIIKKAYGVVSDDGRRLMKSDELYEEFVQTPAYDKFFMEVTSSDATMAAFIKGILPADLAASIDVNATDLIPKAIEAE